MRASPDDVATVTELLGRTPQSDFEVAVRDADGAPMVIRNAPFLADGTPMPTRYWLVDRHLLRVIGTLESNGGVRRAEAEVDPDELLRAHERYAAEREATIPADHTGPRPSGGVGGTRTGVKCLHTHYAWFLAGGDDPVGRWVGQRLAPADPVGQRLAPADLVGSQWDMDDQGDPDQGDGQGGAEPDAGADTATDPVDVGDGAVRGSRPDVDPRSAEGTGERTVVAAIDCGTNSTRLLVAERGTNGSFRTLERLMRITRLGRGVDATGALEPVAIERTVEVLREYREVIDRLGATDIRMTATSAARDATNRDTFFAAATAAVGVEPELISGTEEAALSFRGATAELDPADGPFLVVDIGGGSTEFSFGTTVSEAAISVDIGCVRLTEKFLLHDPPLPEELSNCLSIVELHLDDVRAAIDGLDQVRTFVGLAGTVSAAAAVEIGLATYARDRIHHFHLSKPAIEDVFRTLATETVEERKDNPGLEPQRADVIVGGLCVLVQIMRRFGFDECLVSEADILDGLAMSVLDRAAPR